MTLEEYVQYYYLDENYNCAEALLHACNDYYDLGLSSETMRMMGGFGSGMYSGLNCGALAGCNAALSLMLIENKAHEEMDVIRPTIQMLVRTFHQSAGGTGCVQLKPVHHSSKNRCLQTCLLAAKAMEQTAEYYGLDPHR